jgi:hypothetical protein
MALSSLPRVNKDDCPCIDQIDLKADTRHKPFRVAATAARKGTFVSAQLSLIRSTIVGGSGKFKGATGYIDYFGMADFNRAILVLRYRGEVCYAH